VIPSPGCTVESYEELFEGQSPIIDTFKQLPGRFLFTSEIQKHCFRRGCKEHSRVGGIWENHHQNISRSGGMTVVGRLGRTYCLWLNATVGNLLEFKTQRMG